MKQDDLLMCLEEMTKALFAMNQIIDILNEASLHLAKRLQGMNEQIGQILKDVRNDIKAV